MVRSVERIQRARYKHRKGDPAVDLRPARRNRATASPGVRLLKVKRDQWVGPAHWVENASGVNEFRVDTDSRATLMEIDPKSGKAKEGGEVRVINCSSLSYPATSDNGMYREELGYGQKGPGGYYWLGTVSPEQRSIDAGIAASSPSLMLYDGISPPGEVNTPGDELPATRESAVEIINASFPLGTDVGWSHGDIFNCSGVSLPSQFFDVAAQAGGIDARTYATGTTLSSARNVLFPVSRFADIKPRSLQVDNCDVMRRFDGAVYCMIPGRYRVRARLSFSSTFPPRHSQSSSIATPHLFPIGNLRRRPGYWDNQSPISDPWSSRTPWQSEDVALPIVPPEATLFAGIKISNSDDPPGLILPPTGTRGRSSGLRFLTESAEPVQWGATEKGKVVTVGADEFGRPREFMAFGWPTKSSTEVSWAVDLRPGELGTSPWSRINLQAGIHCPSATAGAIDVANQRNGLTISDIASSTLSGQYSIYTNQIAYKESIARGMRIFFVKIDWDVTLENASTGSSRGWGPYFIEDWQPGAKDISPALNRWSPPKRSTATRERLKLHRQTRVADRSWWGPGEMPKRVNDRGQFVE